MNDSEVERIEVNSVLDAIYRRYGYDFRDYAPASLKRRLLRRMQAAKLNHISELVPRLLYEEAFFEALLQDLSVTVTEMFRDPPFYHAVRENIVPALKTYPYFKVWHAGCATGEEVYSIAILFKEEGIYDRAHIYATDYNQQSLAIAREGIYSAADVKKYTINYNQSGGKASLSDYYYAKFDSAKMRDGLKKNITFSFHNLVTDRVFGEMNLIVCRNVLIYFNKELKERTLALFSQSLCHRGFLCLGSKETIKFTSWKDRFEKLSDYGTICQKK